MVHVLLTFILRSTYQHRLYKFINGLDRGRFDLIVGSWDLMSMMQRDLNWVEEPLSWMLVACMAGVKKERKGVGKGRKGRWGNACYKNPVFCIMSTNFLVIRLCILSIYCQSIHQSECSVRLFVTWQFLFVCVNIYRVEKRVSVLSQSGFWPPPLAAEMNKMGFLLQASLPLSPQSPLLFSPLSHSPPLSTPATQARMLEIPSSILKTT